jgi:hypothetical protein
VDRLVEWKVPGAQTLLYLNLSFAMDHFMIWANIIIFTSLSYYSQYGNYIYFLHKVVQMIRLNTRPSFIINVPDKQEIIYTVLLILNEPMISCDLGLISNPQVFPHTNNFPVTPLVFFSKNSKDLLSTFFSLTNFSCYITHS